MRKFKRMLAIKRLRWVMFMLLQQAFDLIMHIVKLIFSFMSFAFMLLTLSLFGVSYLVLYNLDFLRAGDDISNAELIHSIGIILVAPLAVFLALWRSRTADKQQRIDARGRLDERYQKGAEMLGYDELVVRMGAITILERLSKEHTREFHVHVVDLLAKFVKHKRTRASAEVPADVQESVLVIGRRSKREVRTYIKIGKRSNNRRSMIDLARSNLNQMILRNVNFDNVDFHSSTFIGAKISDTLFKGGRFMNVDFRNARLTNVNFMGVQLRHAVFDNAVINNCDMEGATMYWSSYVDTNFQFGKFGASRGMPDTATGDACGEVVNPAQPVFWRSFLKGKARKCRFWKCNLETR